MINNYFKLKYKGLNNKFNKILQFKQKLIVKY